CPGTYCGRLVVNGTIGECGVSLCPCRCFAMSSIIISHSKGCPRGFRANSQHICLECSEDLQLFDWLYLSFMVIVFVVIQTYLIDKSIKANRFNYLLLTLYLSTICEAIVASTLSILSFNSDWS